MIVNLVVDWFSDEADPNVLRSPVSRMICEILDEHLREQMTWPSLTDSDRLDVTFAALEQWRAPLLFEAQSPIARTSMCAYDADNAGSINLAVLRHP